MRIHCKLLVDCEALGSPKASACVGIAFREGTFYGSDILLPTKSTCREDLECELISSASTETCGAHSEAAASLCVLFDEVSAPLASVLRLEGVLEVQTREDGWTGYLSERRDTPLPTARFVEIGNLMHRQVTRHSYAYYTSLRKRRESGAT